MSNRLKHEPTCSRFEEQALYNKDTGALDFFITLCSSMPNTGPKIADYIAQSEDRALLEGKLVAVPS
jgi:hypothetical protein